MFSGQPSSGTLTRMPFGEPGAVNEPGCGEFALIVAYIEAGHAFGIIGPTQLGGHGADFFSQRRRNNRVGKEGPS